MASTAQVTWVGPGLRLVGEGGQGPVIVLDHALPEEDRQEGGPRPMELLLIGLAGCTAMDVISILKKKKQDVTGFEVAVEGLQAAEHPKYYTDITVVYRVTGRSVDPKAVDRAIELSETKYCGASAMLREKANISHRVEIFEAETV